MLTKGIIQSIDYSSNTCIVRVPLFESAGNLYKNEAEATFAIPPGVFNGYKVNDVVYVGFEANSQGEPIVIGKLYIDAATEAQTTIGAVHCSNLVVDSSATLPADIKINYAQDNKDKAVNNEIALQDLESLSDIISAVREGSNNLNKLSTTKQDNLGINPGTTTEILNSLTINGISYAFGGSEGGYVKDVKVNGNTVVTNKVANIDLSGYLPLAGGTMTGNLNLKPNQYNQEGALNCNNSDIIGINSLVTADLADNTGESIKWYRDSTHYDTLTASNGILYFMPNDTQAGSAFSSAYQVIHTGNQTLNTAGATDTSSKIYLVGATTQAANPQTYSDNEVYTTSGVLTTKSVQVGGGSATIQYNSANSCIEFVF